MRNFLNRLFGRKTKNEVEPTRKEFDLRGWLQFVESADENALQALDQIRADLEKIPSEKAKLLHEFVSSSMEHHKAKKAERIVNEYGQAIEAAAELNRKKVDEFQKNSDPSKWRALQEKKAIYYHLSQKFDIRLLPYDKKVVREALELLLEGERDSIRAEELKVGLLYLEDFIDFTEFD